ncbi:hypothetical protein EJ04DRAFT_516959 [Polyplosphaeria fusca]|uniref:Dihydrofolate reductase n=1 Tax=Polyplosphaeria fusca TaxID=682080 RepID=A0A9P4QKD1_9PLEO|nr:hypothetical protein EJ04DRAFT_516959 [Polyplosphaeria fusca]
MPPPSGSLPLTLILAATPSLGIGKGGSLPWPQLKKEMGYFARVTKRVSPSPTANRRRINAVVMGRKTWDSIPPRFRPLKDRLNVVITRDAQNAQWKSVPKDAVEGPVVATSLTSALECLQDDKDLEVEKVFVIGGASIYKDALALKQTNRVLLTKIKSDVECDTFFDVDLDGEDGKAQGWTRSGKEELERYVGEEVKEGDVEEQGFAFEFCLYEREEDITAG